MMKMILGLVLLLCSICPALAADAVKGEIPAPPAQTAVQPAAPATPAPADTPAPTDTPAPADTKAALPAVPAAASGPGPTAVPLQQDNILTMEFKACMDSFDGEQGGMTSHSAACYRAEYQRQDQRLNSAYKALMGQHSSLNKEGQNALRTVQRVWLSYRDAMADFEKPGYYKGETPVLDSTAARTELTAKRALELEELMRLVQPHYRWVK